MEQVEAVIVPEAPTTAVLPQLDTIKVESVGALDSNGVFIPHKNPATKPTETEPAQKPADPNPNPTTQVPATEKKPVATPQADTDAIKVPRFLDETLNQEIKTEAEQTPYYKRMGAKVGKDFNNEQELEDHLLNLHSQNANLQQTSVQDEGLLMLNHAINSAPDGQKHQTAKYVLDLLSADWNAKNAQGGYQIPDDYVIKAYYKERGHNIDSEDFQAELEGLTSFQKMTMAEPLRREMQNGINQSIATLKEQAKANAPKYNAEVVQRQNEWKDWVDGFEEYAKTAPNTLNGIPVSGMDAIRTKRILEQLKNGKIFDNIFRNPQTKKLDYSKLELAYMLLSSDLHPDEQKNFMSNISQKLQPQQRAEVEKATMEKMMNLPASKPQETRHSASNTMKVSELDPKLQKFYKTQYN
jgi:hypothetical protein